MDFFRRHIKTIFIVTITGFVVSIFAGFGGYYLTKKHNLVAIVNSSEITKSKFYRQFNQALKSKKSEEELNETEIQKQVLRNLIQQQIYINAAKKLKLEVSQNEIINVIRSYPAFQTNNNFDHRKYFKTLRFALNQTPAEFEENIKNEIIRSKMNILMTESVKVSEAELREAYTLSNNGSNKNYGDRRETFKQEFLSNKKMALLDAWFRNIAMNSKIETYLKSE